MIQRGLYLLCCAVLLCIASQNQAVAQGTPLQPPVNSAIQVYLTATGKADSAPVLTQSELTASIDKQPAQVTSLRSAKDEKLLFALVIDRSTSRNSQAKSIREAAMLLFQSLATDGNQGYIVLFNDSALMSKRPLQLSEARETINAVKFGGATSLYDAIYTTCRDVLNRSKNPDFPRRVIILISDGGDNASRVTHTEAEEIAEKKGIAIFSLATPNDERGETRKLDEISSATGGRTILDNQLKEGVASLLAAIHRQWVLSLVPQQVLDKKWHSLAVKTTQRGVNLSAPAKIFLH
jgi:Ca-activated chloride channel family protein